MNITLSPEQAQFMQSQINKGKYTNSQEIIDKALKLLEQQEQAYEKWLEKTRQKVNVGIAQLERGEKVDGKVVIAQLEEKFNRMRREKMSDLFFTKSN